MSPAAESPTNGLAFDDNPNGHFLSLHKLPVYSPEHCDEASTPCLVDPTSEAGLGPQFRNVIVSVSVSDSSSTLTTGMYAENTDESVVSGD